MLKFSLSNSKHYVPSFDIPAGYTCPFAENCRTKADKKTGKIHQYPETSVRCYAASLEALRPNVRKSHWRNFDTLKGLSQHEMADLIYYQILAQLPMNTKTIRIHSSGDFFNEAYFKAWLDVCNRLPNLQVYAYTKSLLYWIKNLHSIPKNLTLTASYGGVDDELISRFGLKNCRIVRTEKEAADLGLTIDFTDALAQDPTVQQFALLIHGTQRAYTIESHIIKQNHRIIKEHKSQLTLVA